MYKKFRIVTCIFALVILVTPNISHAQMMRYFTPISQQESASSSAGDIQDIHTGKDLYEKFQNNQISCAQLQDDDFDKIGEYIMDRQFGNTEQHIQMNERAKQMMGDNGEEQMHIQIGRNATNCNANGQGGGWNMMGWGNSGYGMMGWNTGYSYISVLIQIVILIDLILVGVWLWKRIKK